MSVASATTGKSSSKALHSAPSEGDKAPAFEALADDGVRYSLEACRGKTVVLYFYPKDNTSGCTVEACDFKDSHGVLLKKGAVLFGVSPDSAKSHKGFRDKHTLPFPLLPDEDKKICSAYGVWKEKSMYGRKYMGVERSTFVIAPDGKIKRAWRKVSVPGHVKDVLGAL